MDTQPVMVGARHRRCLTFPTDGLLSPCLGCCSPPAAVFGYPAQYALRAPRGNALSTWSRPMDRTWLT